MSNGITITAPDAIKITAPVVQPVTVTVPQGKPGPPGDPGPPGADAQWASMTQAEYDALVTKDPNVLYVIVG